MTGFHVHRGRVGIAPSRTATSARRGFSRCVESWSWRTSSTTPTWGDSAERGRLGVGRRPAVAADGRSAVPPIDQGEYGSGVLAALGATEDWRGAPEMLATAGFRTVALTLTPDALELSQLAAEINSETRVVLMLGTEGAGLSKHWVGWRRHTSAHSECSPASTHSMSPPLRLSLATHCRPAASRANCRDRGQLRPGAVSKASCEPVRKAGHRTRCH